MPNAGQRLRNAAIRYVDTIRHPKSTLQEMVWAERDLLRIAEEYADRRARRAKEKADE